MADLYHPWEEVADDGLGGDGEAGLQASLALGLPAQRSATEAVSASTPRPRDADGQPFFRSRRATAVLKHAILSKYAVPFASKTGSTAKGRRVVIVDGYAGAGRYDDGEPGSPALIAEAARHPALADRVVECHFVEQDPATYRRLCEVLREVESGASLVWEARRGKVADHLDDLLKRAEGVPLFLFLDPFGLGLPFDVIANIFANRPSGAGVPATEVLFRFDANAVRRIRGVLRSSDFKSRSKTIEALDRAAGGTWWRDEEDTSLDNSQYLAWFEERLLEEITARSKCAGWTAVVKQREDLQPAYWLIFLTRHRDGMEVFGETLSKAQEVWRRAVFDEAFAAQAGSSQDALLGLDPDAVFRSEEAVLAGQLQHRIEQNLRALLRENERFRVRSKFAEVYHGVEGIARITHLRKALKKLHDEGVTSSNQVGDVYTKVVIRAPSVEL